MIDTRYYAIAEETARGIPIYVVIDGLTGQWKHVYDCFLWAERKAEELNRAPRRQSETQGAEKPTEKRFSMAVSKRTPET
jgi:hypothetical protein